MSVVSQWLAVGQQCIIYHLATSFLSVVPEALDFLLEMLYGLHTLQYSPKVPLFSLEKHCKDLCHSFMASSPLISSPLLLT